jgi:hypothetical protein
MIWLHLNTESGPHLGLLVNADENWAIKTRVWVSADTGIGLWHLASDFDPAKNRLRLATDRLSQNEDEAMLQKLFFMQGLADDGVIAKWSSEIDESFPYGEFIPYDEARQILEKIIG